MTPESHSLASLDVMFYLVVVAVPVGVVPERFFADWWVPSPSVKTLPERLSLPPFALWLM